jgi:threonyl-tRNA synthetase
LRVLQAFWHSSAHILGESLEQLYGCDLTIGPVIEEGFYYDCSLGNGRGTLTQDEWPRITAQMEAAVKEAQPFERVEITREEALAMFEENPFKARRPPRAARCLSELAAQVTGGT